MKLTPLEAALMQIYGKFRAWPGYSPLVYFMAGGPMLSVRWK